MPPRLPRDRGDNYCDTGGAIEGAAVVVPETQLIASVVRHDGESFPDLLQRLDAATGKAVLKGVVTNEVNGGRFRLAPSVSARDDSGPGKLQAHRAITSPRHLRGGNAPGTMRLIQR